MTERTGDPGHIRRGSSLQSPSHHGTMSSWQYTFPPQQRQKLQLQIAEFLKAKLPGRTQEEISRLTTQLENGAFRSSTSQVRTVASTAALCPVTFPA